MSIAKKIRPEAVLKQLPQEKQQAIIDYCDGDPEHGLKSHSLDETVAWLRADGVSTSRRALSVWRSWYLLNAQLERNEQVALETVQQCKERGWIKSAADELEAGQIFFTRLAMQQADNLGFARILREQTRIKQTVIDAQKFQRDTCKLFLAWFADKRATDVAAGAASNSEKIEQLGSLMFGEDWK